MIMPFTKSVDIDPKDVLTITVESFVFGLVGIILGSFIDNMFKRLAKKFKRHNLKLILSLLQILLSGFIVALMYVYMSPFFTDHFQRTLSGLAFPAAFYGVQSNIYTYWQN
jgi:uncharacterized protein YacL